MRWAWSNLLRRWVLQLAEERGGVTPRNKALTAEQQKIQALEAKVARLEREKAILKNGYRTLDVGRARTYALIDQLSTEAPVEWLCAMLEVQRSCYYAHRCRRHRIDAEELGLRSRVSELFRHSREAAGSRTLRRTARAARGRPVSLGPRRSIRQSPLPSAAVALSHGAHA